MYARKPPLSMYGVIDEYEYHYEYGEEKEIVVENACIVFGMGSMVRGIRRRIKGDGS